MPCLHCRSDQLDQTGLCVQGLIELVRRERSGRSTLVGITRASFTRIFDKSKIFVQGSCSKKLAKPSSRISRVEVGPVKKRSCRDLPISGLKYLPIRTRSARPHFDHYPMLTRSTRFILKPISIRPYSIAARSIPDPVRVHSIATLSYTITTRAYSIATRVYPIASRPYTSALNTFLQKRREDQACRVLFV